MVDEISAYLKFRSRMDYVPIFGNLIIVVVGSCVKNCVGPHKRGVGLEKLTRGSEDV